MRRDTINYMVVGGIVLVALALLLAVLLRITGGGGETDRYHAYFQRVAGVKYGTPIYYEGYRVGQVNEVLPEHEGIRTRFRIDMSLEHGWPVPQDSVAEISSSGLLSDVFIYIHEGEASRALAPGSEIAGREATDLFAALGELAVEIQGLTESELHPLIELLSERVDVITGDLQQRAPEIIDDTREMMARLNDSAGAIRELLSSDNRRTVTRTLENFEQASENAMALAEELRASRAQLDQVLVQVNGLVDDNRPEVERIVKGIELTVESLSARLDNIAFNLEEASRHFNEFTRVIRRNPNRLIYTPEADRLEDEQP